MSKRHRVDRVKQEILREVNDILLKEIKDPRIEGVTITDVDLTGDLQEATIFYSTLDPEDNKRKSTQIGLDKATGKVRTELSKRLTLYKVPEIAFERDASIDYGQRIDELLEQIKDEE